MATSLSTESCWRVAADEGCRVGKCRLAHDDRAEAGPMISATRVPLTSLAVELAENMSHVERIADGSADVEVDERTFCQLINMNY
jgi:hypothetical protein